MDKATQWKRAAIILRWVDEAAPRTPTFIRDQSAVKALVHSCGEAPWLYEWTEVVRSVRARSEAALAKKRKIG